MRVESLIALAAGLREPTEEQLRRGILWDVFNGCEIQRVDSPDIEDDIHEDGHNPYFDDDDEAFLYVCFAALAGDLAAQAALRALGVERHAVGTSRNLVYIEED